MSGSNQPSPLGTGELPFYIDNGTLVLSATPTPTGHGPPGSSSAHRSDFYALKTDEKDKYYDSIAVQAILNQAASRAIAFGWFALLYDHASFPIIHPIAPLDFFYKDPGSTYRVNGKLLEAGDFGNYIAGYAAAAVDSIDNYENDLTGWVMAKAGFLYHQNNMSGKASTSDPFDLRGQPLIYQGYSEYRHQHPTGPCRSRKNTE